MKTNNRFVLITTATNTYDVYEDRRLVERYVGTQNAPVEPSEIEAIRMAPEAPKRA